MTTLCGVALVSVGAGCEREALDAPCAAGPGDLVISEIRGPQTGEDGYGEWIELYNASGTALDLSGLTVSMTYLDGAPGPSFIVRDGAPTVDADGYVVLGRADSNDLPEHLDYGYREENDSKLPSTASLELHACSELVDRTIFRNLPDQGTYSLDGASAPDIETNDDETAWCTDDIADENTPSFGIRGTPGEMNRPCN